MGRASVTGALAEGRQVAVALALSFVFWSLLMQMWLRQAPPPSLWLACDLMLWYDFLMQLRECAVDNSDGKVLAGGDMLRRVRAGVGTLALHGLAACDVTSLAGVVTALAPGVHTSRLRALQLLRAPSLLQHFPAAVTGLVALGAAGQALGVGLFAGWHPSASLAALALEADLPLLGKARGSPPGPRLWLAVLVAVSVLLARALCGAKGPLKQGNDSTANGQQGNGSSGSTYKGSASTGTGQQKKEEAEEEEEEDLEAMCRGIIHNDRLLRPAVETHGKEFTDAIIKNLRHETYPPGSALCTMGEIGYHMFFLIRGKVKVTTAQGISFFLGQGKSFGEIALVHPRSTRTADIEAAVPCEVFLLGQDAFNLLCSMYPELAKQVRTMVSTKLEQDDYVYVMSCMWTAIECCAHVAAAFCLSVVVLVLAW